MPGDSVVVVSGGFGLVDVIVLDGSVLLEVASLAVDVDVAWVEAVDSDIAMGGVAPRVAISVG